MFATVLLIGIIALGVVLLRRINRDFFILTWCRRIKTADGSPLDQKVASLPGVSWFGNNLDMLNTNPEKLFQWCRDNLKRAKGRSYLLYFLFRPVYNVTTAEDAEEPLQSQSLITKSVIYGLMEPFIGDGLLNSTDRKWHFRRKLLTPAFHFNILQTFLEVFKEESARVLEKLNTKLDQTISLIDIIPEFTLNNVCETALGVKLNNIPGSEQYREMIHEIECIIVKRISNPLMVVPNVFWLFDYSTYKKNLEFLKIAHAFSSKIIEAKRVEYQAQKAAAKGQEKKEQKVDDMGIKKRYAMLDTLLDAESNGLIDHKGICEEVDTFMFEGYDTTSTCLIFALMNLSVRRDIQEKCYEEVANLGDIAQLTVFDFNQLEYLECVIKETLRLYPSVPFISRECMTDTQLNGLVLPRLTQVNVHIFDIMRDERHFPDPDAFKPERFLAQNTQQRHPFVFVPFSAGPRNCIGQKFALLEIKVLLMTIIRNFILLPVTPLEDIVLENGLILRSKRKIQIKLTKRI